ncbi:hypothetical protein B7H23_14510 [Notoacmeibacter marinus]|uniref:Uncharacterized protein n=1 Tax=Notoacmeibacter marinus TaxID=1876515 RepID=A0A231UTW9_9HYPH|nr:hypothetical protein [Notoacmeibacter marinus]OXS99372.1 hypothetical protein B7H23_14510 [Notoacmeibacter marinus]
MERVLGERWSTGLDDIGVMVADRATTILPAPVAGLVGQIWWLLLIVFLFSLAIGWRLGAPGRGR